MPDPTDAREELRDRIEAAIRRCVPWTGVHVPAADAVMAVVEAALVEAEQQGWADADEQIIKPERALHEQTIARAEQAGNRAALYREQVRMEHERAEQAEAAVQRVRTLALRARHAAVDTWHLDITGTPPTATVPADALLAALDQPEDAPPPAHTGGNAEDCGVCRPLIDQPGPDGVLYPWICTGAQEDR